MKRQLIEPNNHNLSIARQCELLNLSKSSYYYVPCQESPENLAIMRLLDEQYLKTPFYSQTQISETAARTSDIPLFTERIKNYQG